jgi:putative ABC transport system ATP-binding protein
MTPAFAMRGAHGGAVVTAHGITRRWPGGGGLAPVDVVLRRGELTVVRGRSGSGKSTLLSIVAGWCAAGGGRLERVDGPDWSTWAAIAVVPQVIGLVPELSISENVELPLRLGGIRRADRRARTRAVLDELDLGEQASRLPRETSLGQRQRAAIARALVVGPLVALVDEPTSHQDGAHATAIVASMRAAAERGSALLVATHDAPVVAVADTVLDLDAPGIVAA